MYSVLIADDEYYVRAGIKNRIDWEELNLRLAGEVENGLAALDFIRENPVDILLTDIRMPEMDGLKLIAAAKQLKPALRCVILSGYDDFSYAQTAIRLGVADYIQKPVDEEELTATFRRIISELETDAGKEVPSGIEETALNKHLSHQKSLRMLEQLRAGQQADFPLGKHDRMGMIVLYAPSAFSQEKMEEWAMGRSHPPFRLLGGVLGEPPLRVLFLAAGNGLDEKELVRLTRKLQAELQQPLSGEPVYAACSYAVEDIRALPQAYRAAMTAMKSKLLYPDHVLYPDMLKPQDMDEQKEAIRIIMELREALGQRDNKRVQILVLMLFTGRFTHVDTLETVLRYLGDIVSEYRARYHAEAGELSALLSGEDALLQFDTMDQLRSTLTPQILDFFFYNESFLDDRIVGRVQMYVRQHLNEDLKVSTLGQLFFLSPNHLSYLFKKETGYTLSDYVENVRMERARALLSMAGNTVSEVAMQVGYADAAYFSRVFKKATGLSPQKYQAIYKLNIR